MIHPDLNHLIRTYGVPLVGGVVAVEGMGIPLPGETTLIAAALYAGRTGHISIAAVVAAAAVGAIAGDNIGFWIGRTLGFRWVVHHQKVLRLTTRRLKLGQYLFSRHGGKVVFFGRFVAVLRAFAPLLAGINCMAWRRFALCNAAGGFLWASVFGIGADVFGEKLTDGLSRAGIVLGIVAVLLVITGLILLRKYEERLEDAADRALPGSLHGPGGLALPESD